MAGDLYLGSGRAADEAELWRAMLHRPVTRITYWPFALPGGLARQAATWLRQNLDAIGSEYELDVWQDMRGRRPEELTTDSTDVLLVGGGNTFRLLDAVRRGGFVEAVRDFVSAGGNYYGGSAGAVLACESIAIADSHDPNEVGLTDLTGLGLLTGVAVLPHFTPDQLGGAQDWSRAHQVTVLGLPETSGLHCRGTTAQVVGHGVVVEVDAGGAREHRPGQRLRLTR